LADVESAVFFELPGLFRQRWSVSNFHNTALSKTTSFAETMDYAASALRGVVCLFPSFAGTISAVNPSRPKVGVDVTRDISDETERCVEMIELYADECCTKMSRRPAVALHGAHPTGALSRRRLNSISLS